MFWKISTFENANVISKIWANPKPFEIISLEVLAFYFLSLLSRVRGFLSRRFHLIFFHFFYLVFPFFPLNSWMLLEFMNFFFNSNETFLPKSMNPFSNLWAFFETDELLVKFMNIFVQNPWFFFQIHELFSQSMDF